MRLDLAMASLELAETLAASGSVAEAARPALVLAVKRWAEIRKAARYGAI
jgi:hypothetical protein